MNYAEQLSSILHSTGYLQPVERYAGGTQIAVTFRVLAGSDQTWTETMKRIKKAEKVQVGEGWQVDISRYYIYREDNDQLGYRWRLTLVSKNFENAVIAIDNLVAGRQVPVDRGGEVTEMPFSGMAGRSDRNVPLGKKRGVLEVKERNS